MDKDLTEEMTAYDESLLNAKKENITVAKAAVEFWQNSGRAGKHAPLFLKPKNPWGKDEDDDGDHDCLTPLWRVLTLREGPTKEVDPVCRDLDDAERELGAFGTNSM